MQKEKFSHMIPIQLLPSLCGVHCFIMFFCVQGVFACSLAMVGKVPSGYSDRICCVLFTPSSSFFPW